jgi:uncharacterized membrane protein YbhN (UPF0104 family)
LLSLWIVKLPGITNPVPLVRLTAAIGAFFPWSIYLLGLCFLRPASSLRALISHSKWWLISALLLAGVTFTRWYIPVDSTPERQLRGIGYYFHVGGVLSLAIVLISSSIATGRSLGAVARVEYYLVMISGALGCLFTMSILTFSRLTGLPAITGFEGNGSACS